MDVFSSQELARYSRQMILPDFGRRGQTALKRSKVLLIGMGGLGSPVALYLAAAGVGTLGLCDMDSVELHNLHRQILHDDAHAGWEKVDSARVRLEAINPHGSFVEHRDGVTVDNALELMREYDVVVDGSDNFPTRYLVSDAACLAGKPYVYGSIFQFEGQVSVFHPAQEGPSYRCLFPQMPPPGAVPNCAEAGVIGALCGIIGSLQALETIKLITGVGTPLIGRLLCVDTLTLSFRTLNIKRDPQSPLIGESPTITELIADNYRWTCESNPESSTQNTMEITVVDAEALLKSDNPPILLDVRERDEWEIGHIEGAKLMPLASVPDEYETIATGEPVLVICHHGMRSLKATKFLQSKGIDATNIKGGIDAWARMIDKTIQRY